MGCDIHIEAEMLHPGTGKWEALDIPKSAMDDFDLENFEEHPEWIDWVGRNYCLFAMFANVRNGTSRYSDPGDGFKPIAMPRGLPDNCCTEIRAASDEYDVDGHSHSFIALRELLDYPVKDLRTKRRGWVGLEQLREWRETGSKQPPGWCGGVGGGGVNHVSTVQLEAYLTDPPPNFEGMGLPKQSHYANFEWEVTYHECASHFFDRTVPALEKITNGKIDDVRLVFFFDN